MNRRNFIVGAGSLLVVPLDHSLDFRPVKVFEIEQWYQLDYDTRNSITNHSKRIYTIPYTEGEDEDIIIERLKTQVWDSADVNTFFFDPKILKNE